MTGLIHSIESMGTVDGPGVRTVVFLQGCALRCRYCHNPDTWARGGGTPTEAEELVRRLARYKPYYGAGGGVTFSGGEPLLQPDFLAQALRLCKEQGIHTCIDTAGAGLGDYEAILRHTDLVLYDVKHHSPAGYRQVTGAAMDETRRFLAAAAKAGTPLWVRHVVVPGLTDSPEHIRELAAKAGEYPNLEKLELLPFRKLCLTKYQELGIPFPLADVPEMSPQGMGPLLAIAESCGKCRSIPL